MVTCHLCDADIDVEVEDLDEGDLITCDECGCELRVIGVDPLELEPLDEEEEDEDHLDIEEEDEEGDGWH